MLRPLLKCRAALSLGVISLTILAGCLARLTPELSLKDRISTIPLNSPSLSAPVSIAWSNEMIPMIKAESEEDGLFTIGFIHVFMREGQLELVRRISAGRISEMAGPFTVEIDHALKTLNLDRGAAAQEAAMTTTELSRLQRFVDGMNFAQSTSKQEAPELSLLGITQEPWTTRDVLRIARLVGADVNWFMLREFLVRRNDPRFSAAWRQLSPEQSSATNRAAEMLLSYSRVGSNAVVISGERTTTGKPMLISDPHLGLQLPNFWLVVGLHTPERRVLGFMIPGVPLFGLGRNEEIAWAGTNMRAASSDLVEVPRDDSTETTRNEHIAVRGWFDEERQVTETKWGPLVSDLDVFASSNTDSEVAPEASRLALRWIGHLPSNELRSFELASKSASVADFQSAFDSFAVSAQNMVVASRAGEIGLVHAVKLPKRAGFPISGPAITAAESDISYQQLLTARDLPQPRDPIDGIIASANNRPNTQQQIGFLFSDEERVNRLRELVIAGSPLSVEAGKQLLLDVTSSGALELARFFASQLGEIDRDLGDELARWNGVYAADLREPVIFEAILRSAHAAAYGETPLALATQWSFITDNLSKDFTSLAAAVQQRALTDGAQDARRLLLQFPNWGSIHTVRVGHPLSALPLIGSRFLVEEFPASGSRETVMKTAHDLVADKHIARYGSQSRFVADLSDPDGNYLILLGGQDGFLTSTHFADQVPKFKAGEYLQVPLRWESFLRSASAVSVIANDDNREG